MRSKKRFFRIVLMDMKAKHIVVEFASDFRLPRFAEIPNVGLYLDQVVQYVNAIIEPLGISGLTASMVSNYVKQGVVGKPLKKRYYADQIAYLVFIAAAKTVLSIDNIRVFISMQHETYEARVAYDYFCDQLEGALMFVFGRTGDFADTGVTSSDEKAMLRYAVVAIANVSYLTKCFDAIRTVHGADPED